jgi:hypothetical protein
MHRKLLAASACLVLVTSACGLPSTGGSSQSTTGGGNQPTVQTSNVLFKDDFSNTGSGWEQNTDSDGSTAYYNSSFRIQVLTSDYTYWSTPDKSFQNNVRIEVDATKNGGPDKNGFGIICRYQDQDNFYRFYITNDGYAGIIRRAQGNPKVISASDRKLQPVNGINSGSVTNHIRADCIDNTLTLYVNGTQVATATDSTFTGGDVGLIAQSFDTGGVDIVFHNFIVYGE